MTEGGNPGNECNIKVVCRVRPLNETEERTGSKFILKFPTDDSISLGVRCKFSIVFSAWLVVIYTYGYAFALLCQYFIVE